MRLWGMRYLLIVVLSGFGALAAAQPILPDLAFGESCQIVREQVLAEENVMPLEGGRCGSPMRSSALDGDFLGFKSSYIDGSEIHIFYFFFEEDRLAAFQVGTTMAMESLNALAQSSYSPFDECFQVVEPDLVSNACVGAHGDVGVRWVASDLHTSLTLYDLRRLPGSEELTSPTPAPVVVSHNGFQVVSYVARWEGETLWIIGEMRNLGGVAAGVELQVIARDATGQLVDVATFWPASIQNIRPGMSYGFRHPVTRERSAVGVEMQIVGTKAW